MGCLNSATATAFFQTNLPLLFKRQENGKHQISARERIVLSEDQKTFQIKSDDDKQTNIKTVEFFKDAIEALYGKEQTKAYCKFLGYNFAEMAKKGAPLKVKSVRRILSGMSQITETARTYADHYTFLRQAEAAARIGQTALAEGTKEVLLSLLLADFKKYPLERLMNEGLALHQELNAKSITALSPQAFQKIHDFLNPIKAIFRDQNLAISKLPIPRGLWNKISFGLEWFGMSSRKKVLVFETADAIKQIEELPQTNYSEKMEGYREVLARYFSYSEATEGALIPAPLQDGTMGYYRVAKQITTGKGMVAYVLTRATDQMEELAPIVLFRGTAPFPSALDSCSTILTDLELDIGSMAYRSGKKKLFDALKYEGILNGDKRLEVIGHSLGGVFAQKFTLDFTECVARKTLGHKGLEGIKEIELALFNSPALDKRSNLKFKRLIERDDVALQVGGKAYFTRGDIVHLAGSRYLVYGCNRNKVPFEVKFCSGDGIWKHSASFFNKEGLQIKNRKIVTVTEGKALDRALINKGFKVFLVQLLRYTIGLLFYLLLIIPYLLKRLMCGWRRPKMSPHIDMEAINSAFRKDHKKLLQLLALPEDEALNPKTNAWLEAAIDNYRGETLHTTCLSQLTALAPKDVAQKVLFEKMETTLKNQLKSSSLPDELLQKLKDVVLKQLNMQVASVIEAA